MSTLPLPSLAARRSLNPARLESARQDDEYPALVMDAVMAALARGDHGERAPINLCQAGSSFDPFEHVEVQLARAELASQRGYAEVLGRPGLRRAIARWYRDTFDHDVSPDRVCVTAGATEALTVAFAMLTRPGGTVVLPASHFPPLRCLAHMLRVRCRFAPVDARGLLDVARLPASLSADTQAIVVCSPSNPHGAYHSADELAAIADLGVPVIADEVYQGLGLGEDRIPSAIVHDHVHVVSSFSKSLSLAGFRVGYLIAPAARTARMLDVKATTSFSTSAPAQAVCEALLPHWDRLTAAHRQLLRSRWHLFATTAADLGLALRPAPQAGLYGLVDVARTHGSSADIALDLARDWATGTVPGSDFEAPDPRFLRLNFAGPPADVEVGLGRIAAYLRQTA